MSGRSVWIVVTVTLAAIAGVWSMPSRGEAYHEATVHLDARAWFPSIGARVRSSEGGIVGDTITEDDLELDDPGVTPAGAATVRLGRHTLRVEGFRLEASGDTRAARTFVFGGRTFPVGSRVTSEADIGVVAADYGFDLVHGEPFALAATLGVRLVSGEATLRAPALGFEERGEFEGPVPAIGLVVIAHPFPIPLLSSLALTARASGLTIGDRGTYFDLEAAAEWLPLPFLAVRAGYRYIYGRGEDGGDRLRFDLGGPYVGLTLAF